MARFIIVSENGLALGLALRLKAEGHSAKLWVRDLEAQSIGKGLVDLAVGNDAYEFGQTVIADSTGFGPLLDVLRDSGIGVFGGSLFADRLEEDRELFEEICEECEIETPKSARATSWEEAAKLVEELTEQSDDGKVVIKPEGKLSGVVPSYVASDAADALAMLKTYESQVGEAEPEIMIQEFISGVAVSTEGWFDGENWVEGLFNHTIENKKTLSGDLGPSAGCAGNLVWPCDSKDPLVKKLLTKLTDMLRKHRYIGPVDVNSVVNEEGVYALEFTPRFGYDAFPSLLHTLCGFDFGSFVYDAARMVPSSVDLCVGFGAGVRLTLPKEAKQGSPFRGLDKDELESFYPYALKSENDELSSIKGQHDLGVMNGFGESVGEAFARAYLLAAKVQVRDLQYRDDLYDNCFVDYQKLHEFVFDEEPGWIAVDLDGTLASYSGWSDEVGEPISKMVGRVKAWLREGKDVRILTARGTCGSTTERYEQLVKVYDWCKEHIGTSLEVTSKKDPNMIRLYDDRVRQIVPNTGELVGA